MSLPNIPEIRADKGVCFGAYRLAAHRITVHSVVDRFMAGESVHEIAEDHGIRPSEVEACLRHRLARKPFYPSPEEAVKCPRCNSDKVTPYAGRAYCLVCGLTWRRNGEPDERGAP